MIRQLTCPDPDRLQKLLDGSLPPADQSELSGHLDTCVNCQHTLEELAAGKAPWADRARQLSRPALAPDAALEHAMEKLRGKPSEMETLAGPQVQRDADLDFLDPSEDPHHLGRLGHYEVIELLGRGGMGVVLKAFDPSLHRFVAIKVLAPHLASNALNRKRFEREARAAAAVSHEHVVAVHAVEEANGLPYLVMEYVCGISLQERLDRSGWLELKEVLRIGMQTAAGLTAAHAQGLIHRDIKPSNILLENGVERVKITDFGLARAVDDASLTQSGVVAGTPAYMAPEQARSEALDHRADLFSLGSVLYALCTGRAPFQGNMPMAVLYSVCEDVPRPIREINPDIPDWLAAIIDKLQAKKPADRFQSAAEVAELMGQHLAHLQQPAAVPMPAPLERPVPPRPLARPSRPRRLIAAGTLALVLGLIGYQYGAAIFRIVTDQGEIEIQTDDPNIAVSIDKAGVKIRDRSANREYEVKRGRQNVKSGTYELKVSEIPAGVEFSASTFTLKRGGSVVLTAKAGGKEDHEAIQGAWQAVEGERVGKALPAEDLKTVRMVFSGDKARVTMRGDQAEGTFTLNPRQEPKHITVIATTEGMNSVRGQGMQGIYKLEGDRLTICMGAGIAQQSRGAEDRPKKFASRADDPRLILVVLKREPVAVSEPLVRGANLLLNPGFEEAIDAEGKQPAAWTAEPKTADTEPEAQCYRDTTVRFKGTASARINKPEVKNPVAEAGFNQWIENLPAGETLYLRGTLKTKDIVGSAQFIVRLWDADDRFLGERRTEPVSATTDWKRYSTSIQVPANAHQAAVVLAIRGKGSCWFDQLYLGTAKGDEEEGRNLVLNSGFEDVGDLDGKQAIYWVPLPRTTPQEPEAQCYRDTMTKYRGDASVVIVKPQFNLAQAEAGFTQELCLPAGERVHLSGYVKAKDVHGSAAIKLRAFDTKGIPLAECSTPPVTGTTDWQRYDASLQVPAGAIGGVLALVIQGKGAVWFDDVQLRTAKESRFVPFQALPSAAPAKDVPPGTQLLTNGNFEELIEGLPKAWLPMGAGMPGVTMKADTAVRHGGAHSATIVNTGTASQPFNWRQDVIDQLPVGKVARLTGWVRTKEAALATVGVQVLDSNGQIIAFHTTQHKQDFKGTADWKPFTLRFPVPKGTARIGVLAMLIGQGQAWFDDFEMVVEEAKAAPKSSQP